MATLLDVFNAAGSLGTSVVGVLDKNLKDEAEAALNSQQLDMQRFMAEEMQNFSERSDYENFQKDWEADFSRKYAEYNSRTGAGAYKNQYTAKMGNRLLDQYKASGDIAMQKMIAQGERNRLDADYQNQITTLSNDAPSQARMDAMASVYRARYEKALDTPQQYEQNMRNAYNATLGEMTSTYLYDQIQSRPALMGKTDAELSDYLMKQDRIALSASVAGKDGKPVELSTTRRTVMDEAVKQTRLKVKSDWQKNDNALTAEYSDIDYAVAFDSGANADALTQRITSQIQKIRGLNGSQLSDEMKLGQIKRLEALLSPLTQSGSKSGGTSSARKTAFENALKDTAVNMYDLIMYGKKNAKGIDGYSNFYEAETDYKQAIEDAAAEYGIDRKDLNLMMPHLLNNFVVGIQNRVGQMKPEVKKKIDSLLTIPKTWEKEEPYKSAPELVKEDAVNLAAFVWSCIAKTDMNDVDTQFVENAIDEYKKLRTSKELDWMQNDPKKAQKQYASAKGFARAEGAVDTEDRVFVTMDGDIRYVGGRDTEEKMHALEESEMQNLANMLHLDKGSSVKKHGYEVSADGHDRTSRMIYSVTDDNRQTHLYKFGTEANGKAVILEKAGNDWVVKTAGNRAQEAAWTDKKMSATKDFMLSQDKMPDFSDVKDLLPKGLRDYTQVEWSKWDGNRNSELVDAIIKARYKPDEARAEINRIEARENEKAVKRDEALHWKGKSTYYEAQQGGNMTKDQLSAQADALKRKGYTDEAVSFATSRSVPNGAGVSAEEWDEMTVTERIALYNKLSAKKKR